MKEEFTCLYCGTKMYGLEENCTYCGATNNSFKKKIIVENKPISEEEKRKLEIYRKRTTYATISLVCGVLSIFTMVGPGVLIGVLAFVFGYLAWPNKEVRNKAILGMSFGGGVIVLMIILFLLFGLGEIL